MRFTSRSHIVLLLLALFCMAVLLPMGCAPVAPPEPQWELDANAVLDRADAKFAQRQYDESTKIVNAFLYKYPKSRHRDRAFYLLGELRLVNRDYQHAIGYYQQVLRDFPSSSFFQDSKYKLGVCAFELKQYELAIANLEDRSRTTDPGRLRRIADMLSTAYIAQKKYLAALKEYLYLSNTAQTEQQKAGYRDRVRELIEKNLSESDLKTVADGSAYPADLAQLRLASSYYEERKYRDAVSASKDFLSKYPQHPEKTRAEMILNQATSALTSPRFTIGVLVPQSGQLAFYGDRVLKGVQLAVYAHNKQFPDTRVELLVKDTEGSPEKSVAALNELAGKGVVAAVGPLLTKEAEALVPFLDKTKIPVITPAASGEGVGKLSPWLFRNALTSASQAMTAAQYISEHRLRKVAIFYPDDAYGKDLTRLFTKELERKGTAPLASVSYPAEVKDFGPYARRVIEIDLRSRRIAIPEDEAERKKLFRDYTPSFDALYLPGHADKIGLIIPQLAFYNIKDIAMIGSNDWHSRDLLERAEKYADGALFTDGFFPESTDPMIKAMVDGYRSAYQEEPDILSAQAYDAAMMVVSLIKARKETPLAIRDGLLSLKDYPGVSGLTTFPGNGEAQKKLFLITVRDGKFVLAQ